MAIDGVVSRTHNPAAQARIQTSVPAAPASVAAKPATPNAVPAGLAQTATPALPSTRLAAQAQLIGGGQKSMSTLPGFRGAAAAQPGIKQAYADSKGSMTPAAPNGSNMQNSSRLAGSETTNGSP